MPSKRSRAWKRRKRADEAAARLVGTDPASMKFEGVGYQYNPVTDTWTVFDGPLAREAAARLDGTYNKPVKLKLRDFEKVIYPPFQTPRLDGRRNKR